MDNVSVSKGVFAFQGSYRIGRGKKRPGKAPLFNESWYKAYKEVWSTIEKSTQKINSDIFARISEDLKSYVSSINYDDLSGEIPTAILLTGVNLPDHGALFQMLARKFQDITSHIAIIQQRDSYSLKNMMEETVFQLINNSRNKRTEIQKNHCTSSMLNAWYQEYGSNTPLLIIIPDFESFSAEILQNFILILSVYSKTIKFVLIFGVATAVHAAHRSLPHHVTSKLRVQVFQAPSQVKSLSGVLDGTVLSTETPFKLTGRAFQLLTDIFLFYDFSVNGFLQGYKMCMFQHFYGKNINSLCCNDDNIGSRISALRSEDLDEIKKLNSIAEYVRKLPVTKRDSLNDEEFKELLSTLINQVHTFTRTFQITLKCLHHLTSDLPNAPLGKQLREVYAKAVSCAITESQEYKECLQYLGFISKEELLTKLDAMKNIIEISTEEKLLADVKLDLEKYREVIRNASPEVTKENTEVVDPGEKLNRAQLKEKLLKLSKKHSISPYKQAQTDVINYLDQKVFSIYLKNPALLPGSEIFFFNDGNAVKHHIVGSPRAAIHTGLNNPQAYLDCSCCTVTSQQPIVETMPDLSLIYKLHLEGRRLINMYDWLQSFLAIVCPDQSGEERREVDPELQARFTRAVAELQFLGFIKSSRKKTDHVMRLTWGCS
ncbi:origin recognition complex subunit 3 isoform X1 [Neodiprion fabricii]|uniref:origin recognition complex subunit 3 isoform X1 n=2 Tax=Neodiprion fabricii TaxID=2872261 RepID=UPI001ED8F34A|nr:origin recognition complex subunit 3 isoform X1 [Neodiprion fabricii]